MKSPVVKPKKITPERIQNPVGKQAHGFVQMPNKAMIPYSSDNVAIDGAKVHVWLNDGQENLLGDILRTVSTRLPITNLTYSDGGPASFATYELLRT